MTIIQKISHRWVRPLGQIATTGFRTSAILALSFVALSSQAFQVQVGTAPESNLPLILGAIQSARQSLLVNIYELSSPEVAQALIDQINRGIHVEILQEGEPVGGIPASARGLHVRIAQAMASHPGDRYVEMRRSAAGSRRFRYDHAKYIVIDNASLLLGSENYSPGGQPEPGTQGNRGWEVLVHDPRPATWFAQLFIKDSDARNSDIQNLLNQPIFGTTDGIGRGIASESSLARLNSATNPIFEATSGQIITSPDTSLKGIVGLIQSARQTLDIEEMSFNLNWVTGPSIAGAGNQIMMSPLGDAIVTAARKGVHVRILLNDEFAFSNGGQDGDTEKEPGAAFSTPQKTTTNRKTIAALLSLAHKEKLPIEARIADLRAMKVAYIHNKGLIVDRRVTLISSINWTQNSITNNREAGLALTSPRIADFYGRAFEQDWQKSATGAFSAFDEASARGVDCPRAVSVKVAVGAIRASRDSDPSYSELQNRTMVGRFTRDPNSRRCILLGPSNTALEFKQLAAAQGTESDLEAFTSTYKPYSFLAIIPPTASFGQPGSTLALKAILIEGSPTGGGRKRRLGQAVLNFAAE